MKYAFNKQKGKIRVSLQGSVMCNCFKQGKTKKPPIKRECICFEDGYAVGIYPDNTPQEEINKMEHLLFDWQKTACSHEDMYYTYVECYQRNAYLLMRLADEIGKYPILSTFYPSYNGGSVELERVKLAEEELEEFCLDIQEKKIIGTFFTDMTTNQVLYQYFTGQSQMIAGTWLNNQGFRMWFDSSGFYVTDLLLEKELFHSYEFIKQPQKKIESISPRGYRSIVQTVLLTDLESNHTCIVPDFLKGIHWKVINRPFCLDDLYCIASLKKLIKASLETKNPIQWH